MRLPFSHVCILHHPPGSVRSSLSQSLPITPNLQPSISLNGWFDSAEYASYCTTSTTGTIHSPHRCILTRNPSSQNERLHPDGSRTITITHTLTFSDPVAYAFWSQTNTSTSADVDRCRPLPLNLPPSISKPNYNVVIASSSISMAVQPPLSPTYWTTSLPPSTRLRLPPSRSRKITGELRFRSSKENRSAEK